MRTADMVDLHLFERSPEDPAATRILFSIWKFIHHHYMTA